MPLWSCHRAVLVGCMRVGPGHVGLLLASASRMSGFDSWLSVVRLRDWQVNERVVDGKLETRD